MKLVPFLLGITLAGTAQAGCLETSALILLKTQRDAVGLRNIEQLIAITDMLDKVCPHHDEAERAQAVEDALNGLCSDWPCVNTSPKLGGLDED